MKVLLIIAHPYEKSYNHAIKESLLQGLKDGNKEVDLLDLYTEGFNPVMSKEDLRSYVNKQAVDTTVLNYQDRITTADHIIFLFPIWYMTAPAILKGFFDRVLIKRICL